LTTKAQRTWLTHNWSVGGRTWHVDVREWFLQDLKEEGAVEVKWIAGDDNSANLITKNLAGPLFEKHARTHCGDNEHMKDKQHVGGTGVETSDHMTLKGGRVSKSCGMD
jgi:hypothetical protein